MDKPSHPIIAALTPERLKADLGMTDRAIRHARSTGRFAAGRYLQLKILCESEGIDCPINAFSWKSTHTQDGCSRPDAQPTGKEHLTPEAAE